MNKEEKLFWNIFRNVFLFTHIKSFLKFKLNSKSYQDSIDVEWMLLKGRIELLRDKVKRSEYLKFPDGFGYHYVDEEDNDSFKLIFKLINQDTERDYQFYCQLFTNYSRYIVSIDRKALWAVKTNCLVAYKVLVDKFNHIPSYRLLPVSIISNSTNLIEYLLNTNNNHSNVFYKDNSAKELEQLMKSNSFQDPFEPMSNQDLLWKVILTYRHNIKFDVILFLVSKYNQVIDFNLVSPDFKLVVLEQLFQLDPFLYFTFIKFIQICKLILLLKIDQDKHVHSITMDQLDELLSKPIEQLETRTYPTTPLVKQMLDLYFSISNCEQPAQFKFQFGGGNLNFKDIELRETSISYGDYLTVIYKYSFSFANIDIFKYWLNVYFNKTDDQEYNNDVIDSLESRITTSSWIPVTLFSNDCIKNEESLKREYILNLLSIDPKSTILSKEALLFLLIRYDDLELLKFTISNIPTTNIQEIKLSNKFSFSSCIKSSKLFEYCWEIGIFSNQFENQQFVMDEISKWLENGKVELIKCFDSLTMSSEQEIIIDNIIQLPLVSLSYIIGKPAIYKFEFHDRTLSCLEKRVSPNDTNTKHYINIIKQSNQINFKYDPYTLFDITDNQYNYQNINWVNFIDWILTNCQNDIKSGKCHFSDHLDQYYLSLYQTNRIDLLFSLFQNTTTTNIKDLGMVIKAIGYQGDIINLDKLLKLDGFTNKNLKRDLIKICLSAAVSCGRLNIFQYILDNEPGIFEVKGTSKDKELAISRFSTIVQELFYQDDLAIFEFIINNLNYPQIFTVTSIRGYLQKDGLIYKYHFKENKENKENK